MHTEAPMKKNKLKTYIFILLIYIYIYIYKIMYTNFRIHRVHSKNAGLF